MKTTFKFFTSILCILTLVLTSCSKDGDVGPQGVQGDAGQDGVDGIDGEDGNANIMYSDWFTVSSTDWSGIGGPRITFVKSAPEITQRILDTGVILVYHRFEGKTRQLPYTFIAGGLNLSYFIELDTLNIEGFNLSSANVGIVLPFEFRYIILPAGVSISGKGGIDFTKMTYEEVMDHFGLGY